MSAGGGAFILVFAGALLRLLLLDRSPTASEVLFALLSLLMAIAGAAFIALGVLGRLELTAEGFRVRGLRGWGRMRRWIDVQDISPYAISAGLTTQKTVAYRLTPAARARAGRGLSSFFGAGRMTVMLFGGLSNREQAELMERWRQRWTASPSSERGEPW